MALSIDNVIQSVSGTVNGTGTTVTFPNATTAGSVVLMYTFTGATGINGFSTPTGGAGSFLPLWFGLPSNNANGTLKNFYQRNVAGGENNYTLDLNGGGASEIGAWVALEVAGVGLDPMPATDPWFLQTAGGSIAVTGAAVGSKTSASVPDDTDSTTECFTSMAIAAFGANNNADTTIPTISGYPVSWDQIAQPGVNNGSHGLALAVVLISLNDLARVNSSANVSPNSFMCSDVNAFYADGGKYSSRWDLMTGFEFGTVTGLTSVSGLDNDVKAVDGSAGSPEIVTAHPRSGSYCLKLSAVAAVENITWIYSGGTFNSFLPKTAPHAMCIRVGVYFETLLPIVDVELGSIEAGSLANGVVVSYRTATQKIGVKIGTGTEVLCDATVSANQWIDLHLRYNPATTTHVVDWYVDYDASPSDTTAPVAQTQVTKTSMTSSAPTTLRLGWTGATTATVFYDDLVVSKQWGSFPLGDVRIQALKADPAGSVSITGTSSNFETFTSNGTGAAWNGTTAITRIDDVPPVIGASSDGIMQVSVATNDFANIPMETFTGAPDYCLRAARAYFAGWAASGNPAAIQLKVNDGTTDVFTYTQTDATFDATNLVWVAGMVRQFRDDSTKNPSYLLTQARLDAMTLKMGGSSDANPDIGLHAVLIEVGYVPAVAYQIASAEDGVFTCYVKQDPLTGAHASYVVTTPPGIRGATLTWTKNGTPGSLYVNPNNLQTQSIGADTVADVTAVGLAPDGT